MQNILKKYWGYDSFRPKQKEIIDSALEGKDVLAILPTGGGKSICFQIPALMREGICIVISPLIALMKDQVQNLNVMGIKALAIYSGMTYHEMDIALDNAIFGDYKFLYVSPERLRTELFKVRLAKMNVNYLVVDEAHCISQWGYDFRPDYLQICAIRKIIKASVIALTATATVPVAEDIMTKLEFKVPNLIRSGFERPNLAYVVRKAEDKLGQLLKICNSLNGSGIVYVGTRKTAENVSSFLNSRNIDAHAYHAGMGRDVRSSIQDEWKSGKKRIIVATNAFGMGIDKSDVRFVCHFDVPDSIESYFQEAGRAGRDELHSFAVLLWNGTDISRLKQIGKVTFPPLDYIKDIYQKVFIFLGFTYETGKGCSVKFELEAFAKRFKLHAATAYYAIKYIERAGYWSLTEELEITAKLQFIVNRDELYRLQLGSVEWDAFIQVILRLYTGIFSDYVPIDEEFIARQGRYAVEVVKTKLIGLSKMKIVKYIPKIKSPMLNINNERLYEKNFLLPQKEYDEKLNRVQSRINDIIAFVEEDKECRSKVLLKYFGQEKSKSCGICDVCIANKKSIHLKDTNRRNQGNLSVTNETESIMKVLNECGGDFRKAALRIKEIGGDDYDDLIEILRKIEHP
ncbi:MAG: ATP-dependent DNA helicase RecQ [Bacteroidales bacterium]|jgi:ATP-dependent DNA helicase RecQ